jgi:hypothetical protein
MASSDQICGGMGVPPIAITLHEVPRLGKDPVEHAKPASADEPVVERLVRTYSRRIVPGQIVLGYEVIPMTFRRISTLGASCHSVKNETVRRICASDNRSDHPLQHFPCDAVGAESVQTTVWLSSSGEILLGSCARRERCARQRLIPMGFRKELQRAKGRPGRAFQNRRG